MELTYIPTRPTADRVKAISEVPVLHTAKHLRRFLGAVNFYHRFIPNAAEIMAPLNDLLRKTKKTIDWTPTAQDAFEKVNRKLSDRVMLHFLRENAPLYLLTDASGVSIGAVLHQEIDGQRQPLAFASRKLSSAEGRYPTFDR